MGVCIISLSFSLHIDLATVLLFSSRKHLCYISAYIPIAKHTFIYLFIFAHAYPLYEMHQEAIYARMSNTKEDWTKKSRPGTNEMNDFYRRMDSHLAELKSLHQVMVVYWI